MARDKNKLTWKKMVRKVVVRRKKRLLRMKMEN
jgi:hypothetical protein